MHFTRQQILDSSKLKEFADDKFKFDENGRKLSKLVENTVGKGEISCFEQFLLFPQCLQKVCFPGASKGVVVWEWVKILSAICFNLDQSKVMLSVNGLNDLVRINSAMENVARENIVGKEEMILAVPRSHK